MKRAFPQAKFAVYFAVLAIFSALCLGTIFRYEKNSVARHGTDWASARTSYGQLPLSFQENLGQTDPRVRFVSRGPGYELFLTPEEAVLALHHPAPPGTTSVRDRAFLRRRRTQRSSEHGHTASVVRIRFAGASSTAEITGAGKLPGRVDYFSGNNPSNWHTDVPFYSRVQYRSLYPGVDLVFYGNQRQLEYDFVMAPKADPKSIGLEVEGATQLRVDSDGNLLIGVKDGEVELRRPVAYQQVGTARREIPSAYVLAGANHVTFAVSNYDRALPVVIDPVLVFSTYIGGTNNDISEGIAVDSQGDVCITGQTLSTDFPIPTGVNTLPNGAGANTATWGNVFVSVFKPDGSGLVYSAYLSGNGVGLGPDFADAIAVDSSNNIYVTGITFSDDFPVTASGLITTAPTGNPFGTAFLTKINPSATGPASLLYSTYLGGSGNASTLIGDEGGAIAVDASGNAYVVGTTASSDFPTVNQIPSPPNFTGLPNALGSAFVARIDTTKSGAASLIYSTLLGGDGANALATEGSAEFGLGVAVDSSNNAYVTGTTTSSTNTFPTTGSALQASANASNVKGGAFFSKINTAASGSASLVYSTYLEGDTLDEAQALALGPNGIAYITGDTSSSNFPTTNTTATSTLANGVFPSAPNTAAGVAFLTLIDPSQSGANSLQYSVLLGGTSTTGIAGTNYGSIALGVQADTSGKAYLAGATNASDFPITFGAFQTAKPNPSGDAFIAQIQPSGNGTADLSYSSYFGGAGPSGGGTPDQAIAIALDTATPPNAYIAGSTASAATGPTPFPVTAGAFQTSLAGNGTTTDAFAAKLTLQPRVSVTPSRIDFVAVVIGTTSPPVTITVTNNTNTMLTGLSFTTMGGNSGDFAAVPGGATPCGSTLASGASCTANATFTPSAPPAVETTTLDVNDSDSSSPQTVILLGTGNNPPADFPVTAPTSFSVAQGASGSFQVTVTPVGGFNQTVMLACSGAPANSTCTLSSGSVVLTDGKTPVNDTVTITTDMNATAPALPQGMPSMRPPLTLIAGSMLAIALLVAASKSRRYRAGMTLAGIVVLLVAAAGCNRQQNFITPMGTTTLTITATSGNLSRSATISLTVTAP
jgi:Beta-propeller repeat